MVDIINQKITTMNLFSSSPFSFLSPSRSERKVERVRYELKMREVSVARKTPVGESLLAITFTGEALADFESRGFDDHCKFMFTTPAGEAVRRDYTPRHFDREKRELTLEFALHEHGHATDWASAAKVGDKAVIGGPRGSMIVPTDLAWYWLIGDASAFPAIRRRLEELPAGAHVEVVVLCAQAEDRSLFAVAAPERLHCVSSVAELHAKVRELALPQGEGYAWCAGESAAAIGVREILRQKGLPKEVMRVAAYWKEGAADFHEKMD